MSCQDVCSMWECVIYLHNMLKIRELKIFRAYRKIKRDWDILVSLGELEIALRELIGVEKSFQMTPDIIGEVF